MYSAIVPMQVPNIAAVVARPTHVIFCLLPKDRKRVVVWRSASSALSVSGRRRLRLVPVITAIYGHCDVLQGTEGASQRPQISCSVDKKSPHDMIGKLFALKNEPTLSLFNCQMPDFAHAAVFNSHHRPNESLINLHWSILTAPRTFVAS